VVRNLISNAIKFTHNGGKITVTAQKKTKEIEVSVQDTGVGISPDDLKTIFNSTILNIKSGTNDEKGTGLGLFLCKEMVERNGGKIWATSEPDKGTTFYFTVPFPL
jgi:signal transduction histidine kinase